MKGNLDNSLNFVDLKISREDDIIKTNSHINHANSDRHINCIKIYKISMVNGLSGQVVTLSNPKSINKNCVK